MIRQTLRALVADDKGVETIEYAVFAVAVIAVVLAVVSQMGATASEAYKELGNWVSTQFARL
jgi:Flp pilus assembly pilin Flp